MAKRKGSTNATEAVIRQFPVGDNQTLKHGDPLILSSGKAIKATGGMSAGTFLGFAVEAITTTTATSADVIGVDINPNSIYEIAYVGSSKTSLLVTDIGTLFDYKPASDALDLDDTTGATMYVVGYDNDANTADIIVKNSVRAF